MSPSFLPPRSLDLTGPLLLGGVPDLPESFPVRTRHFVGCMRNLQVDSRHMDMADFIANNGTVPGMGAWGRGQARRPMQRGGVIPGMGTPAHGGLKAPSSHRFSVWRPRLSPLLSILGCPAKKNVCDSNTCHNGGTCVNQWDSFSCECPLGFGGKSCAQGRRGSSQRLRPGHCQQCWEHWQGLGRHWAGTGQGPAKLGCGWKSVSGQSPERAAQETKGPVRGRPGHSVGRAQGR